MIKPQDHAVQTNPVFSPDTEAPERPSTPNGGGNEGALTALRLQHEAVQASHSPWETTEYKVTHDTSSNMTVVTRLEQARCNGTVKETHPSSLFLCCLP